MGKGEGERGGGGGREDGEGKRYRQTKGKEIQKVYPDMSYIIRILYKLI